MRVNGILESAPQRGPVLEGDRLPEVAELGGDPREVGERTHRGCHHRTDALDARDRVDALLQPRTASTSAGMMSSTPTGRQAPARNPAPIAHPKRRDRSPRNTTTPSIIAVASA